MNEIIKLGNYMPSNFNASVIVETKGISPTVMENHGTVTAILERNEKMSKKFAIRKLSVRECFRLQGAKDEIWDKCSAIGISDSQGYKIAGNGLTSTVVQFLMEHLYKSQFDESYECTDEKILREHPEYAVK